MNQNETLTPREAVEMHGHELRLIDLRWTLDEALPEDSLVRFEYASTGYTESLVVHDFERGLHLPLWDSEGGEPLTKAHLLKVLHESIEGLKVIQRAIERTPRDAFPDQP